MIRNLTARIKQQANEKVVQLLQHDNMHKFKYYKTLPDKIVKYYKTLPDKIVHILQDVSHA
jgi:hypothetical protein